MYNSTTLNRWRRPRTDCLRSVDGNEREWLAGSSFGQLSGTTVAESAITIALNQPSGVVLDADNYLFIVDCGNNRIIGSGPNGFRCVAGCSGLSGSSANQLYSPGMLSFDSYGNIFVTDRDNNRIQKFLLATSSCGKCLTRL